MKYTRREFGRLASASLSFVSAASALPPLARAQSKPNSLIDGVQIGVITPFAYHNLPNDARSLLQFMVRDNISATEIQSPPVEAFAGAPVTVPTVAGPRWTGSVAEGHSRPKPTPDQVAERKQKATALSAWRLNASMDKFAELRRVYNDAGVTIYAFKLPLMLDMPDAEYDYAFRVGRALGATHLTMELPENPELSARVGRFAEKHKMRVGYHAHLQATPHVWDVAMSQSPYNCINLDIGHYTEAGNTDQVEFIEKNHDRIVSMHMKDYVARPKGADPALDDSKPFGQGQTPIRPIMQLMKRKQYGIPVTIEQEYPVPEGSDSEKEIVKCLAYLKAALA